MNGIHVKRTHWMTHLPQLVQESRRRQRTRRCAYGWGSIPLVLFLLIALVPGALRAQAAGGADTWSLTGIMSVPRSQHTATLLTNGQVLVAGGCSTLFCNTALAGAELYNPGTGTWTPTGSLLTGRYSHTATALPDGQVLVAGGCGQSYNDGLTSAELYDPGTGTWSATGQMHSGRYDHTATLLATGQVLVVGGINDNSSGTALASAELYDPGTGTWSATGSMSAARYNHTATLLPNGKVLVTGGCAFTNVSCPGAEVYDPGTGTWTATGTMITIRTGNSATLLPTGQVLVAGGLNSAGYTQSSAELYDPGTNTWMATGSMTGVRDRHAATLLHGGQVLVAGGFDDHGHARTSAELYDPHTGNWTGTGNMNVARLQPTATLLLNGQVLITGGQDNGNNPLASAELYSPGPSALARFTPAGVSFGPQAVGTTSPAQTITVTDSGSLPLQISSVTMSGGDPADFIASGPCLGATVAPGASCTILVRFAPTASRGRGTTLLIQDNAPSSPQSVALTGIAYVAGPYHWAPTGSMTTGRENHTATLLPTGMVLVTGGYTVSAELYNPGTGTWMATGSMTTARWYHTATLLANGKVLVAGGCCVPNSSNVLASAELYDPHTGTWTATGSMATARQNATATLLPNGRVLLAGGCTKLDLYGITCVTAVAGAELYDPGTGTWAATGSMAAARWGHTATLLPNGKVLVAGGSNSTGSLNSAELYNPHTGTWTATGALVTPRDTHTAALLSNGRVLVAGGEDNFGNVLSSAELYDPSTGMWAVTGAMHSARYTHTMVLLSNGQALVAGGDNYCSSDDGICTMTASAELYDPHSGLWTRTGSLITARQYHTATLLPTGKVLVAGGVDINANDLTSAELYTP